MSASPPSRAPDDLPRWAEWLLARLASAHNRDVVVGDFAEVFRYVAATEGRRAALGWCLWQMVRSLPAFLSNGVYFGSVMFSNYLKVAFRNLRKRKFYAALNIGGLAIGMAVCLLIFQYVAFETSFDDFHEHREDLYRVNQTRLANRVAEETEAYTHAALAGEITARVPEVTAVTRLHPNYGVAMVVYSPPEGERIALSDETLVFADPSFLDLFTLPFRTGDPATALHDPGTVLVSATAAQRLFGDADPLGKSLYVRGWAIGDFTVAGVFEDLPPNSHLSFDFVIPLDDLLSFPDGQYADSNGWDWTNFVTYLRLHPDANRATAEAKIHDILYAQHEERWAAENADVRIDLQAVEAIHLYSTFEDTGGVTYKTVYFFSLVGLFVLLIAWVNYINLSTARAMERAKEVGVRKVVGARQGQVVAQFLFESAVVNGIALVLAVGLASLGVPWLNQLAEVEITGAIWREPWVWGGVLGVFGLGALVASLYPAFVLAAFRPVAVLKGSVARGISGEWLRRGLVVFQFAASLALLTGTYIVYEQVQHMRAADLGFDAERILVVRRPGLMEGDEYTEARSAFVETLGRHHAITHVATSATVPGNGHNLNTTARPEAAAPDAAEQVHVSWVNEGFFETWGLPLVAGRFLEEARPADLENGLLINETTVTVFGYESPEAAVGQTIILGRSTPFTVVGVVEDYHWMSVRRALAPNFLALTRGGGLFSIRVEGEALSTTLDAVRTAYTAHFPGNPFDYFFADANFDEQYRADRRFGTLFGVFALFALVVACLGLIGLAAFTAARRTKEIGIRKVMGAGMGTIMRLLLRDIAVLVVVALLVTTPLMYLAADHWLADFAFHIDLGVGLFLVPAFTVLAVALLTVSYHTVRTARLNPIESLRYE